MRSRAERRTTARSNRWLSLPLVVTGIVLSAWTMASPSTPPGPPLGLVEQITTPGPTGNFGYDIAADGNLLAVASYDSNDDLYLHAFTRAAGSWGSPSVLPGPFSGIGADVRLDVDGSLIAVGGWPLGTALLYENGSRVEIDMADAVADPSVAEIRSFGSDVAVDAVGSPRRLAVGARTSRVSAGRSLAGAVYLFEEQGDGSWLGTEAFDGIVANRQLGNRVALSGSTLAMAGAQWVQIVDLDDPASSSYGAPVAGPITDLAARGNVVAASYGNRVAVFRRSAGAWDRVLTLNPPGDGPVEAVALHGSRLLASGGGDAALYDLGGVLLGSASVASAIDTFGNSAALTGTSALVASRLSFWIYAYDATGGCESVTATPDELFFGPFADSAEVSLDGTPDGCAWTATRFGHLDVAPTSGVGDATITVGVGDRNFDFPAGLRQVRLSDGGTIDVHQSGMSSTDCSLITLDEYAGSATADGGTFTVRTDTSPDDCDWTTVSAVDWLSVTPTEGSGAEFVTITADANTTPFQERVGEVFIGGRTFTVSQLAPPRGVACGEVIGYDTTLVADVDCTGLGRDGVGLRLEPGVTLYLDGHDIRGPGTVGLYTAGTVGVLLTEGAATIEGAPSEEIGADGFDAGGSIVGFDYGAAAVDASFPCPSLSSITERTCPALDDGDGGGAPGVAISAPAAPGDLSLSVLRTGMTNRVGLFSFAASVTVVGGAFTDQAAEAIGVVGGALFVEGATFEGNGGPGIDVETAAAVSIEGSTFTDNVGAGVYVVDAAEADVADNEFVRNNSALVSEPTFNGQLAFRFDEQFGEYRIRGNTFVDDTFEGLGALDPDDPDENERPAHGAIGLMETPEAPTSHSFVIEGNTFHSGDAAIYLWGGYGNFVVQDNLFGAGLSFNVGVRDGTDANHSGTVTLNCKENARATVVDPTGGTDFTFDGSSDC